MDFDELPGDDYQNLWFQLRTWTWRSIAVLPMESTSELDLAEQLVVIGVANTHRRMTLISAEGVTLRETDALIAAIRAAEDRGDLVVVCVDSVDSNPATAPIVRAVNGVVLCVRLERSSKRALNHAMRLVGRRRILGVVTRSAT